MGCRRANARLLELLRDVYIQLSCNKPVTFLYVLNHLKRYDEITFEEYEQLDWILDQIKTPWPKLLGCEDDWPLSWTYTRVKYLNKQISLCTYGKEKFKIFTDTSSS